MRRRKNGSYRQEKADPDLTLTLQSRSEYFIITLVDKVNIKEQFDFRGRLNLNVLNGSDLFEITDSDSTQAPGSDSTQAPGSSFATPRVGMYTFPIIGLQMRFSEFQASRGPAAAAAKEALAAKIFVWESITVCFYGQLF